MRLWVKMRWAGGKQVRVVPKRGACAKAEGALISCVATCGDEIAALAGPRSRRSRLDRGGGVDRNRALAIFHLSSKVFSRGSGQSAVCAAAYRHGAEMWFEREGRMVSYTGKHEVIHSEFALPTETPAWLRSMVDGRDPVTAAEAFWNAVENRLTRENAQLAREVEVALPVELSREANIELIRAFVAEQFSAKGMVVSWAYHDLPDNPHAHILVSMKPLTETGFGSSLKPVIDPDTGEAKRTRPTEQHPNGKIVYADAWGGEWGANAAKLRELREAWATLQNEHLAAAGITARVDQRSHAERGIEIEPTQHMGMGGAGLEARGKPHDRTRVAPGDEATNIARIAARPDEILRLITDKDSVFDRHAIAIAVARYVEDPQAFQNALAQVLTSPELVPIAAARVDVQGRELEPEKFSTRSMIEVERRMVASAMTMAEAGGFKVSDNILSSAFDRSAERGIALSAEQREAVKHIAAAGQFKSLVGFAGAGKSTLLAAAREAWEASGYRVQGAALAGKAVAGLAESSGIRGSTLAGWEARWQKGEGTLGPRDVLVIDEAGMVGSVQLERVITAAQGAGAKVVLVGDAEQLQPINAGAAFRAIAERVGYVELAGIRRQAHDWMRAASVDFARGRTEAALAAYREHGALVGYALKERAIGGMVAAWAQQHAAGEESYMLAHSREDVAELNELARQQLVDAGVVAPGHEYLTATGAKQFAAGDRIVFLQNDRRLGVQNGLFGTVVNARAGQLEVSLADGRAVEINVREYAAIDHGYAATIHKAQGMTATNVHVLAARSLDRHMTYVAMTRHRESVKMHYSNASFRELGGLAAALSRSGLKATTLDFEQKSDLEQATAFGDRRGWFTPAAWVGKLAEIAAKGVAQLAEQGRALLALSERLQAADPRSKLPGMASEQLGQGRGVVVPFLARAVTTFDRTPEDVAIAAARASPYHKRVLAEVTRIAAKVYRAEDVAKVVKRLEVVVETRDAAKLQQHLAGMRSDPARFGRLRHTNLLGLANAKARAGAAELASDAKRLRVTFEDRFDSAMKEERERRTAMATAVPALSADARRLAGELAAPIQNKNDVRIIGMLAERSNAAPAEELKAFAAAVDARFGTATQPLAGPGYRERLAADEVAAVEKDRGGIVGAWRAGKAVAEPQSLGAVMVQIQRDQLAPRQP